VLASLSAFLAFDYFLVPPLYIFTINRWEEWIALCIFLATALLMSQLTVVMRERTALAQRRERESTILYELIHLVHSQERLENQLKIVTESFIQEFASWGVQACVLLLADEQGIPTLSVETSLADNEAPMTPDERMLAIAVMTYGRVMEERTLPQPDHQDDAHRISQYSTIGPVTILRFLPLKTADRVLGVLCLRIQHPVPWFSSIAQMLQEQGRSSSRIDFFWTFLEQATSILERAYLRLAVQSEHE
jgi:two-component system sensor histidine kinase KdpD